MHDPIMEEVYTARRHLWEKGGGTMHGVCEYLRKRRAERMARRAEGLQTTGAGTRPPEGKTSDLAREGTEGDAE